MAPRLRRPEVNASMHLCSRTLTGEQSPAGQAATHQQFQLVRPKSPETIPNWTEELQLEILVGFGINPDLYKVIIHEMTPSNQPCPQGQELKSLKDTALDQIVTGPYEVHIVLKDGVRPPTIENLRQWQQRYAAVAADLVSDPPKHMFTLCQPGGRIAKLAVDSLKNPPEGDVERTLRHGLGLISTKDIMKHNLGKALDVKMMGREVKFHLNREPCNSLRDIEDLNIITLVPTNVVKVHVSSASGAGTLAMGDGGDDEDEETDED